LEEQDGILPPPKHVNEEVALVFGVKEAKAMLQFCSQGMLNQELRVTMTFHWGGRPILMETKGPSFSAQLIMATLDHKLLGGLKPVNTEAVAERERRASRGENQ
jgi:Rad9